MKLLQLAAIGGLALATVASPAVAQRHTTTTVTRVHGPLKILPHAGTIDPTRMRATTAMLVARDAGLRACEPRRLALALPS
jgi:hypothetical protein